MAAWLEAERRAMEGFYIAQLPSIRGTPSGNSDIGDATQQKACSRRELSAFRVGGWFTYVKHSGHVLIRLRSTPPGAHRKMSTNIFDWARASVEARRELVASLQPAKWTYQ